MRRRFTAPAVSLFPFLAVLLCAMGALILLLLVLTRQIREDALRAVATPIVPPAAAPAEAQPEPPEPVVIPRVVLRIPPPPAGPAPPDPNNALREQLAAATAERDAAAKTLERLRLAIAQRQDAARSAEAALASSQFDVEAVRRRLAAREAELREREAEQSMLRDAIKQAEGSLAASLQAAQAAEPKYSIMPYEGHSGTARRPILIECTGTAIRFLPEGIELSATDIEGFLPDYNPLLAGTMALREHWRRVDGLGSPRPYVLLLVREDGVAAYYAARSMLRALGGETGYELITEEMKLAVPEVDPAAREICRAAVNDVLRERPALLAAARRSSNDPLFPSGRFEVDPNDHDPTRPPESPFGGRSSTPLLPPERPLPEVASPRTPNGTSLPVTSAVPAQGMPAPREPLPSPEGSRTPAGSVAWRLAQDERQRRALPALPSEQMLEQALAEQWPSFTGPAAGKRRWGASAPTANIALERPVPIEVTSDRIIVGVQEPISIGPHGVTAETVRAVVAAIDAEANAWGRSPGQFYWSPRPRATIRPGGTRHFDRLKSSLGGMGLRVSDRITLEPTVPAFLELSHAAPAP